LIESKLNEVRRRLLDLTRNNRLINHRRGGQRTLEIVDELPGEICRILVEEGRVMQFLSREEAPPEIREKLPRDDQPPAAGAELPLAQVAADGTIAQRHKDSNLQTALSGEKLQTRLVNLAREANSALQEQGCNILYLTLGMVEWCEADESSEISRAPLVFVPVELKRKNVNTRYSIQAFDDDILANANLIELCQNQFKLTLPGFDAEKDELDGYFAAVRQAIAGMSGWRFLPELHVGLFSFSKLLMYRDLDPRNWPESVSLTGNPLIQCLTGIENADLRNGDGIPDPITLDQITKPADSFQIVDADSSQQAAILAAKRGVSMVIDGPPGTGKSQTITNIIAECLAANKTVLFVSEKAAALEVVKRRLKEAGLDDFVLELHSRQASKRAVLEEINRVLQRDAGGRRVENRTAEDLQRARDQLNTYHRELHENLQPLDVSPFIAMSRAIGLASHIEPECDIPDVLAWSADQLAEARQRLEQMDRRLERVGNPAEHPWRGVELPAAGIKEKQTIVKTCGELISAIAQAQEKTSALASVLARPVGNCWRDFQEHLDISRVLLDAPAMTAAVVQDARFDELSPELQDWLKIGKRRAELISIWQSHFKAEAETQDWKDLLDRRKSQEHSIWRWIMPSWYSDGKRLRSVAIKDEIPSTKILTALAESGELRRQIERKMPQFTEQFGPAWRGFDGDWAALEKFALAATAIRKLILAGKISVDSAIKFADPTNRAPLTSASNEAQNAMQKLQESWHAWLATIASDEQAWLLAPFSTAGLAGISARLAPLPGQLEKLDDWIDLRQSMRECSNSTLKSYVDWIFKSDLVIVGGNLPGIFLRHFYRLWVEQAMGQRPSLRGFRGQDHESLIAKFRELDRQWLLMTRDRLISELEARRPDGHLAAHRQSKLGLVQAEIRKKTRHMPLRKLFAEAGEVMQSIKPCFMMSPLSVAQYLAPGGLQFDVVIFDEASQVEPADAYGAVARGRQLLLVGDENQLPPTNFFARADVEDEDGDESTEVRAADLQSVLSLGIVRMKHRCGLRWHYRSRHSSLIEFSNEKFYDGRLRVFPSPHTDCSELGLAFRFVPNAVYQRGAGRFNPIEAAAVAAEVIRHAVENPQFSLGIGTLNLPQQRAIEDEIERLRRRNGDARIEKFFNEHAEHEPFFVKNLENIQGDERDVIFLSVGFGKDAEGRLHVNFGALNPEGGWKRLNVLITRARQRCIVFSSIHADDIDLGATQSRGVVTLKEYLDAAEKGIIKSASVPVGDHDSDFEASVCRILRDKGWEVHAQVGCAGFAIDLAVVDPRHPGRYLLGIECDGATYHSSPTARDRDRLRQAVLENLGWKIFRIWSTDFFHRPQATMDGLLLRLEELKIAPVDAPRPIATTIPPPAPPPQEPESPKLKDDSTDVVPYKHSRGRKPIGKPDAMLALPAMRLAGTIRQIVGIEGPIHVDEAIRACVEMYDAKATARPKEAFERALQSALETPLFTRRENFLWPNGMKETPVRFRGGDCPVTDAEMICPEEYAAAVRIVLQRQFGLKFDALIESVAHLFGFVRTGPKLKAAVEQALIQLDEHGEIHKDNAGFVTLRNAVRA